jgi:hypothetical protein
MLRLETELYELQKEFQELHCKYGLIPKWEFMLQSVLIVDKMRLIEKLLNP